MAGAITALQNFMRRRGVAAYTALAIIIYRVWVYWCSKPRGVHIPVGRHWLLGVTAEFFDVVRACLHNEHLECLLGLHWQSGRTFAAKPPLQPWWLFTTCPKNVEYILATSFPNYPKGPWMTDKLSDLLGRGIFNVDGKEWYHQRRTVSRMLSDKVFKEHIWSVARRNAKKLRDILRTSGAAQPLDLFDLMNRFALDTIGEIGFGKCIGSLEDPSSSFLLSFDKAQRIALKRFFTPFWRVLKLFRIGFERESREHFGHLDQYARSVVRDLQCSMARKSDSAKSSGISWADIEARKCLVGLYLVDAKKRGKKLAEDYLRDVVLNYLVAGRDTTAQALSWTLYCLCNHPEVADKARDEINQVCGWKGPAYEDIDRLPFLQAVIHETLRLYPPLPLNLKTAANNDTWPDGTFVPRGTVVLFNLYAMGRDPSIWGEDAAVFNPQRWLDMTTPPNNYSYPIFNAGPRECIGKILAQVEMKTCLATILPQFLFQLAIPADEITHDMTLTIGMRQGLPCFVKPIEFEKCNESGSSAGGQSENEAAFSDQSGLGDILESTHEVQDAVDVHQVPQDQQPRPGLRRRSGRARQREKKRIRVSTPSPDHLQS